MKETEDFDQTWAVPSDDLDATWPMMSAAPETAQAADSGAEQPENQQAAGGTCAHAHSR